MPKLLSYSRLRMRAVIRLRQVALGLAIVAPLVCVAWRAGTAEVATGAIAAALPPALDAAGVRSADAPAEAVDAGGRAGKAPAAHTRGSTLTAAGPDGPRTFLATAGLVLEPISQREGPQARMRVRGLRVIRGAPSIRLALNPDAPRVRHRTREHLETLPVLAAARAGALPLPGTALPPPHSS